MDLGDDDLFSYRGRSNAPPPPPLPPGRLTAHVAPVATGRRPDDQSFGNDFKPGRNFGPGPRHRPPPPQYRYASDDYYSGPSRYDRDFSRDNDSYAEPQAGTGLLADLIPDSSGDSRGPVAVKPELTDGFRSRPVARNPSPERIVGPAADTYRNYERQRFDSPNPDFRNSGERYGPPQNDFRHKNSRPQHDFRKNDMRSQPGPRNAYDRSAYPAKGGPQSDDTRPVPEVYQLPKIQKRVKGEEEINEGPQEKLVRLRVEHAKLEMRIQSLEKVVQSAQERETDFRRSYKGSLADNSQFSDTMKLLNDAKRQLDSARQEYSFKDDVIKKLLQKPAEKSSSDNSNNKPAERVQILATDFLDEKREEREEETDVSSKLEFYDGSDHWCQQCNFFPASVTELLAHLHSSDHWAKNKSNASAPWPLIKRASNFDQDRSLAAIKGSQFMIPCHGFYCAICKVFAGDSEAGEEHLFSISHNKMVQRFFLSKPEYEHVYNKDRMSAKSKADADARKQKREAEDRRLREEEAKKKTQEEETRKKEMEIRERLIEDNKHIKRMRELEDKKEKEKLRKDRERVKDKERERERKRRNRIQQLSSDDDVVSSDDDLPATPPDPKLLMPCSVTVSAGEAEKTMQLFKKHNRTLASGKHLFTASSTDPETAVWSKVSRFDQQSLPPASVPKEVVSADFNDDSCEEFSLQTVTAAVCGDGGEACGATQSISDLVIEDGSKPKKQLSTESKLSDELPDARKKDSSPEKKAGSPMEEMILNALTDCLTPPVVGEEDEPPVKKHKKSRESRIEVITGDDPQDEEDGAPVPDSAVVSADPDDGNAFPILGFEELVNKSP